MNKKAENRRQRTENSKQGTNAQQAGTGTARSAPTEDKKQKLCPACGELKPADNEHFYKDKSTKDGLSCWCKVCKKNAVSKSARVKQAGKKKKPAPSQIRPHALRTPAAPEEKPQSPQELQEKPPMASLSPAPANNNETLKISNYMQDAQGRLVPKDMVKEIDKLRDELVKQTIRDAEILQHEMQVFKTKSMQNIRTFMDTSASRWGVELGGKKGNITLFSFDGKYKAEVQVAEDLMFDEQLQIAKELIDQCLTRWTKDSRNEIKVLINDAFQVDKEGRINTKRILTLRRIDIKDKLWQKAMDVISASLQVVGSKEYLRLYKRTGASDQWEYIPLNMAAL